MHSVWSTIEWIGNTLLFLLAGIILGSIEYEISSTDVASVVVVYLLLQVIRVVIVIFLYPALANLG
jgi:NhaP-type Na+/H+ or K+/H+ antiporter